MHFILWRHFTEKTLQFPECEPLLMNCKPWGFGKLTFEIVLPTRSFSEKYNLICHAEKMSHHRTFQLPSDFWVTIGLLSHHRTFWVTIRLFSHHRTFQSPITLRLTTFLFLRVLFHSCKNNHILYFDCCKKYCTVVNKIIYKVYLTITRQIEDKRKSD